MQVNELGRVGYSGRQCTNVYGGSAGDVLIGDFGSNVLAGNGGNDLLDGFRGGLDVLIGGTGADQLLATGIGGALFIGGDVAEADRNNVQSMRAIQTTWNLPANVSPILKPYFSATSRPTRAPRMSCRYSRY